MNETTDKTGPRPLAEIRSYHAHVYYDPATSRNVAERLRVRVGERFHLRLGRWHDEKIGPHDQSMFQIAFVRELFGTLVPWLMLNHDDLSILVHPNTTHPRHDHIVDGIWIGKPLHIHGDRLPENDDQEEDDTPNTSPHLAP